MISTTFLALERIIHKESMEASPWIMIFNPMHFWPISFSFASVLAHLNFLKFRGHVT